MERAEVGSSNMLETCGHHEVRGSMPPRSLSNWLLTNCNYQVLAYGRVVELMRQCATLEIDGSSPSPSSKLMEKRQSGRAGADCKSAAFGLSVFESHLLHQIMEPGICRAETQHCDCAAGRRDSHQFMGCR